MVNVEIINVLEDLGLNRKESGVYLGLLKVGQCGATRLSSLTGINRVTIYGILESLKEKAFVTSVKKESKTEFIAIEPKRILNLIKQKEIGFSAILPELESLSNTVKSKSSVKVYEGVKSVQELMVELFSSGKQIYSFGNMSLPEMKYEFRTSNLRKLRLMSGTKIKGIGDALPSENVEKGMWRKLTDVRLLKSLSKLSTWTYIWEGKVINVSYNGGLIAELIEDEEFANTMKFLWDGLWAKAKKL